MTFLSDSYTKLKKLVIRTKKEISINWFIWLKVLIMNRDISLTKCGYQRKSSPDCQVR